MTEDRSAIVTGGASGIGLATVRRLIAEGWRVVAADRDADALAAIEVADTTRLRAAPLDVTDDAAVDALVAETAAEFGPLRGVVNCAGLGRDVPFLESTAELFRTLHEVNVIGTFLVSQAAARRMTEGGAIVNITSVSGLRGNVGRAAYGATKGALVTLTQVMAVELARRSIRVNAIAPGPIETPMVAAMHTPQTRRQWADHVPLGRYGAVTEVATAIAFLLDEARAGYITGQVLPVDGGFTAGGIIG